MFFQFSLPKKSCSFECCIVCKLSPLSCEDIMLYLPPSSGDYCCLHLSGTSFSYVNLFLEYIFRSIATPVTFLFLYLSKLYSLNLRMLLYRHNSLLISAEIIILQWIRKSSFLPTFLSQNTFLCFAMVCRAGLQSESSPSHLVIQALHL